MDSLLGRRKSGSGNGEGEGSRRFKTEFMVQMDGISAGSGDGNKTLLIGCTNCPWDVDDAVMRRFQRRIYIPLPDRDARRTLWKALVEKANGSVKVSSRNLDRLGMLTQGFSCSDIAAIANEAAFGPLRDVGSIEAIKGVSLEDVRPIEMKDFETSIKNAKKSVSVDLLKRYKEWESAQAAVSA
jgi:SpoVK/Ycf46/Vps4 family AAA+-type ATPase